PSLFPVQAVHRRPPLACVTEPGQMAPVRRPGPDPRPPAPSLFGRLESSRGKNKPPPSSRRAKPLHPRRPVLWSALFVGDKSLPVPQKRGRISHRVLPPPSPPLTHRPVFPVLRAKSPA